MSNVLLGHGKKNYFDSLQQPYQSPSRSQIPDYSPENRYMPSSYLPNSLPNNPRRAYEVDSVKSKYGYQADPIGILDSSRRRGNDYNSYSPGRGKGLDLPALKPILRDSKEIRPAAQNELRSFLTNLTDVTINQKKMPELKPSPQRGLFADWHKDPTEENVKKEQKKNEWKQYLDSQVNDKQMKKQNEREMRIAQELKDEEKFKRQYIGIGGDPYDNRPNNESFALNTKDSSGHYEHKPLKGYDLPPIGYPSRYENPYRDYYLEQHRSMVYEEKPYISAINPAVHFSPLDNQLDMLKRDLQNSQKVFGDHLRSLKLEVERTTKAKMEAQKNLIVAKRRDPSLDARIRPIDILDNYINKYDLKKHLKEEFKSNLFKSNLTDRLVKDPSYRTIELTQGSDHASSNHGLIVGVKDQFVKITENVEMNHNDLPQKTNFVASRLENKELVTNHQQVEDLRNGGGAQGAHDQDGSIFESQGTSRQNGRRSFLTQQRLANNNVLQENVAEPGGFNEDGEWKNSEERRLPKNGFETELSKINTAENTLTGKEIIGVTGDITLDKQSQVYDPSLKNVGKPTEKSKFVTSGLAKPDQVMVNPSSRAEGFGNNERSDRGNIGGSQHQYGEGSLNMEAELREEKKRDLIRKSHDESALKVEDDLTFNKNEEAGERGKQRKGTNSNTRLVPVASNQQLLQG